MGLTLSEETSNRVSAVVLPLRLGRNDACHCGSGIKYKRSVRDLTFPERFPAHHGRIGEGE